MSVHAYMFIYIYAHLALSLSIYIYIYIYMYMRMNVHGSCQEYLWLRLCTHVDNVKDHSEYATSRMPEEPYHPKALMATAIWEFRNIRGPNTDPK